MARSRKHCCGGKLHITLNNGKKYRVMHRAFFFFGRIYIAGRNKTHLGLHVKCPTIFVQFLPNLNIEDRFLENSQISDFMQIGPVVAALIAWTDGQTDG